MPPQQQLHSFTFFVHTEGVREAADGGDRGPAALERHEVTCAASGLGKIVTGDHEGNVFCFDRTFSRQSFTAYTSQVTHIKQLRKHNGGLVTIGDDQNADGKQVGVLKFWPEVPPSNRDAQPLRSHHLFSDKQAMPQPLPLNLNLNGALDLRLRGNSEAGAGAGAAGEAEAEARAVMQTDVKSPVVTFDITEDKDLLACGLTDGTVLYYKGDLLKVGARGPKWKRLPRKVQGSGPVTWLGFKRLSAKKDKDPSPTGGGELAADTYILYVLYREGGVVWLCNDRKEEPTMVSFESCPGCEFGCACMVDDFPSDANDPGKGKGDWRLVVASQSGGISFFGGREMGASGSAGTKQPWPNSVIKRIGSFRSYLWIIGSEARGGGQGSSDDRLMVYDLLIRIQALNPQSSPVRNGVFALTEWGSIFVLSQNDGETSNVNQRLAQFEEKDMQTKLQLLVKKSHFELAIKLAQSMDCERHLVVDMHRQYGDSLFSKKMDYKSAVDQYIHTIGSLEPSYVIQQFLDAQQIQELTRYLEKLHERKQANEDHTTLLLNCYTKLQNTDKLDDFVGLDEKSPGGGEGQGGGRKFDVETAIRVCRQAGYLRHAEHLAENHRVHTWYLLIMLEDQQKYKEGLEYIRSLELAEAEEQLHNYGKTLLAHLPDDTTQLLIEICTGWKRAPQAADDEGGRNAANADDFLPCFVDAPHCLKNFLESMQIQSMQIKGDSEGAGSQQLYNTLLELYLTKDLRRPVVPGRADEVDDLTERQHRALDLLTRYAGQYDREHALVLVRTHDFREGILHLYKELGLYQDILQYFMRENEYNQVIAAAREHGKGDPNMWMQVLQFLVEAHGKEVEVHGVREVQDLTVYIQDVLRESDLPPLVVIKILSTNSCVRLEIIREYVAQKLQEDNHEIRRREVEIRRYQEETYRMRSEIRDLQCNAQTFQASRCTKCSTQLNLPAVHFMCKHSYHKDCLTDRENECPASPCAREFAKVTEAKRQLDAKVEDHDEFFQKMAQTEPRKGFEVIAEYFGRSIFNGEYPQPDERQGTLYFDIGS
eukprot:Hpha_TRINITY_DN16655_c0_g5::TRINITY_DN16655_c0_g5_i1::g.179854::m.179854/K20179/VPS11, PEP5; vacuolar protein sorting-associated protein 11